MKYDQSLYNIAKYTMLSISSVCFVASVATFSWWGLILTFVGYLFSFRRKFQELVIRIIIWILKRFIGK